MSTMQGRRRIEVTYDSVQSGKPVIIVIGDGGTDRLSVTLEEAEELAKLLVKEVKREKKSTTTW